MSRDRGNLMGADRPPEGRWWWALPILATLATYASTFTAGFVWDDYDLVVHSPLTTGPLRLAPFFARPFWRNILESTQPFYRPLVSLSFAVDHALWGDFAGGYHLTNLLAHLVATLLLVALCRRAGAGHPVACLLGTLFAVFPRLSESVAWIAGRSDVLAGLFVFAALLSFQPGPGRTGRRVLSALAILVGLFCKEVAVAGAVALAVIVIRAAQGPGRLRRAAVDLLPLLAALAVYGGFRLNATGVFPATPAEPRTIGTVAVAFGQALATYAWMGVDALRPRIPIGDLDHLSPPLAVVGFALLTGVGAAVWRWRKRLSGEAWAALGMGGTALFLVAHLVRLDAKIVAADRYLYLPMAAAAWGGAGALERAWRTHRRWLGPAGFAVVALFAVTTSLRAQLWGDELALWRTEAARAPDHLPAARVQLVVTLLRRLRYAEALAVMERIPPGYQDAIVVNRATSLDKSGRRDEAIALLEQARARQRSPLRRDWQAVNLMLMHARNREFGQARVYADELAGPRPGRPDFQAAVAQVKQAADEWAALPPEAAGEPLATRVARATWFAELGALPEAQTRWLAILRDPATDPETLATGAGYLVFEGQRDAAREALAILARRGELAAKLPQFEAALADRFENAGE